MSTDVYEAAMRLLSMREHGRFELKDKLLRKSYDSSQIDDVLQQLINDNLLSDLRYTESYIRSYAARGHGPIKIRMALRSKRIDSDLIDQVFLQCDQDWFENLRLVWQRKYQGMGKVNKKDEQKQFRFLQQRGFSSEHIMQLIKQQGTCE